MFVVVVAVVVVVVDVVVVAVVAAVVAAFVMLLPLFFFFLSFSLVADATHLAWRKCCRTRCPEIVQLFCHGNASS